ncbi:MAG: ImmA/IrrE family metallo-endopeptidase [Candidatus Fermentibacteraceae bacterium]|nr:ImmA/IrrE family metallo-endopeptidase [Candidatus Fermentibacteraceae bacterium]
MIETTGQSIGRRVRKLRESWSLSQRELAEVLQLKHSQSVSDIEKGERALKVYELSVIAKLFHVSIEEILGLVTPKKSVVLWRGDNTEGYKKEESRFIERCNNYKFIAECTGSNRGSVLPWLEHYSPKVTAFEEVYEWAHMYRKALSLGDKPACSIRDAIEDDWGVWVFYDSLSGGSAACTKGDFGVGILLNSKEPRWRQNFSLAHELFHILTWGPDFLPDKWTDSVKQRNETLANIFASALLMPEESVRADFRKLITSGRVQWYDIMMLARSYAVSTIALVWRLVNLKLIPKDSPDKYESSSELHEMDDRLDCNSTFSELILPERYVRLAYKAYNDSKISIGRLAELLETSVSELSDELLKYDIQLYNNAYKTTISTS